MMTSPQSAAATHNDENQQVIAMAASVPFVYAKSYKDDLIAFTCMPSIKQLIETTGTSVPVKYRLAVPDPDRLKVQPAMPIIYRSEPVRSEPVTTVKDDILVEKLVSDKGGARKRKQEKMAEPQYAPVLPKRAHVSPPTTVTHYQQPQYPPSYHEAQVYPQYPPTTVSQHQATVSQHQPTVSQYQPTVSQYQPTVSQYQPNVSQHQATVSQHPATVSQHQPTVSQYQATVSRQCTTSQNPVLQNLLMPTPLLSPISPPEKSAVRPSEPASAPTVYRKASQPTTHPNPLEQYKVAGYQSLVRDYEAAAEYQRRFNSRTPPVQAGVQRASTTVLGQHQPTQRTVVPGSGYQQPYNRVQAVRQQTYQQPQRQYQQYGYGNQMNQGTMVNQMPENGRRTTFVAVRR